MLVHFSPWRLDSSTTTIPKVRENKKHSESVVASFLSSSMSNNKKHRQQKSSAKKLVSLTYPHSISILGEDDSKRDGNSSSNDQLALCSLSSGTEYSSRPGEEHTFLPLSSNEGSAPPALGCVHDAQDEMMYALQKSNTVVAIWACSLNGPDEYLAKKSLKNGKHRNGLSQQGHKGGCNYKLSVPDGRYVVSMLSCPSTDAVKVVGALDDGSAYCITKEPSAKTAHSDNENPFRFIVSSCVSTKSDLQINGSQPPPTNEEDEKRNKRSNKRSKKNTHLLTVISSSTQNLIQLVEISNAKPGSLLLRQYSIHVNKKEENHETITISTQEQVTLALATGVLPTDVHSSHGNVRKRQRYSNSCRVLAVCTLKSAGVGIITKNDTDGMCFCHFISAHTLEYIRPSFPLAFMSIQRKQPILTSKRQKLQTSDLEKSDDGEQKSTKVVAPDDSISDNSIISVGGISSTHIAILHRDRITTNDTLYVLDVRYGAVILSTCITDIFGSKHPSSSSKTTKVTIAASDETFHALCLLRLTPTGTSGTNGSTGQKIHVEMAMSELKLPEYMHKTRTRSLASTLKSSLRAAADTNSDAVRSAQTPCVMHQEKNLGEMFTATFSESSSDEKKLIKTSQKRTCLIEREIENFKSCANRITTLISAIESEQPYEEDDLKFFLSEKKIKKLDLEGHFNEAVRSMLNNMGISDQRGGKHKGTRKNRKITASPSKNDAPIFKEEDEDGGKKQKDVPKRGDSMAFTSNTKLDYKQFRVPGAHLLSREFLHETANITMTILTKCSSSLSIRPQLQQTAFDVAQKILCKLLCTGMLSTRDLNQHSSLSSRSFVQRLAETNALLAMQCTLSFCTDVSERDLVVMLKHSLCRASVDSMAKFCLGMEDTLKEEVEHVKLLRSMIRVAKEYTRKMKNPNEAMEVDDGNDKEEEDGEEKKNENVLAVITDGTKKEDEDLVHKLTSLYSLYWASSIVSYSKCNEAILRNAFLTELNLVRRNREHNVGEMNVILMTFSVLLHKMITQGKTQVSYSIDNSQKSMEMMVQWMESLIDVYMSQMRSSNGNINSTDIIESAKKVVHAAIVHIERMLELSHVVNFFTCETSKNVSAVTTVKQRCAGENLGAIPPYSVERMQF